MKKKKRRENLLSVFISIICFYCRFTQSHGTFSFSSSFELTPTIMHFIFRLISILSLLSIIQSYSVSLSSVGKCLRDLATEELTNSYNYLQLSSKSGTTDAYPGFSSLFIELSDNDVSKSHDIVKFLTLRKISLDRLINVKGVQIRNTLKTILNINDSLADARHQNRKTWQQVQKCHQDAENINDANIQDYLESNILNHHIKIDKLFSDLQHRITDAPESEKDLITYMIDEELLNTYGDRRKDIFS